MTVIGYPYYSHRGEVRRLTWVELESEATKLWGAEWMTTFVELAGLSMRQLRRWKDSGIVTNDPVTAMIVAMRTKARYQDE